jgi:hypothetical protein
MPRNDGVQCRLVELWVHTQVVLMSRRRVAERPAARSLHTWPWLFVAVHETHVIVQMVSPIEGLVTLRAYQRIAADVDRMHVP